MFNDSSIVRCETAHPNGPSSGNSECVFWSRFDGQLCVQYFRPGQNALYQPHTHSEYNLVICLSGAVTVTQLGETHTIGAGGVTMGNFGVEHSSGYMSDGGACEAVCLTVTRKTLAGLLVEFDHPTPSGATNPVFLGAINNDQLLGCARDMARELRGRECGHKIIIEGLAMRMLVEALRTWPRSRVEKCEVDMTPRLARRDFIRAYEFMRWCRKDEFRLQKVSSLVGSSEERFARLFQATTNVSPAGFYNRLLLERGRSLLGNPDRSVKEVGYELGYKTPSHFIVAFRNQFGASPQDYRRQCGGMMAKL